VQAGGLVLTPAGSHIARLVVLYGGPGRSARPPR